MWDFDAEVDSLDPVPEEFRGLYTEKEGKFVLHGKLAAKLNAGTGAHNALRTERDTVKTLKTQLAAFKAIGETPEAITDKMHQLEEDATKSPDKAAIEATISKRYETKEATLNNRIKDLESSLANRTRESDQDFLSREIADAISASNAIPAALRPVLREHVRVERDDNGERRLVITGDDGSEVLTGRGEPITSVKVFAEYLKGKEDFGFAFKASGNSGAGTAPNGGKGTPSGVNPFDEKTLNLADAQELISSNPNRARELAKAAGYPVNW